MFLRFRHVRQRKEVKELIGVRQICSLGVEISSEGLHARLVYRCLFLQERVDTVHAKVNIQLKFQPLCGLLRIMEDLGCLLEELLSKSSIEELQNVIFIEF